MLRVRFRKSKETMELKERNAKQLQILAMSLYCQGVPITDLAKRVGVGKNTIYSWKRRNFPENWEVALDRATKAKIALLESQALEDLRKANRKQQIQFQAMQEASKNFIVDKMKTGNFDEEIAADLFLGSSEAERKLYVDPERLYVPRGTNILNATNVTNPGADSAGGVVGALSQSFDLANGLAAPTQEVKEDERTNTDAE